jgi:hypothetical protein
MISTDADSRAALSGWRRDVVLVVFVILGVWLSWQVVREAAIRVLPYEAALRLAPRSPLLLGQAAEAEFLARRSENALWLARRSLGIAPFNVTALRTAGLALGEVQRRDEADQLLTLAGNWSLRDEAAHGWLVDRRLRQGDYGSAFAHADAMVRRRNDLRSPIFDLFTAAAHQDDRARTALAAQLKMRPPWRAAYLAELNRSNDGLGLAAGLAVALKDGPGRFDGRELGALHGRLAANGHYAALRQLRDQLAGPEAAALITNGTFSGPEASDPLNWTFHRRSGLTIEIAPGPGGDEPALRIVHDSFSGGDLISQTLLTPAGRFTLEGRGRPVEGDISALRWRIGCEGGRNLLADESLPAMPAGRWSRFTVDFVVPAEGCVAQRLALVPRLEDRRRGLEVWFDDLEIRRR